MVAIIAAADPSIAQIPQSHFTFLEALRRSSSRGCGSGCSDECWPAAGGQRAEQSAPARRSPTSTTVTSTPDGLRLAEPKYYCTGATASRTSSPCALVVADEQEPATENARVPTRRHPRHRIVDDWDGFGQRTTSSGTVTFTDVAIDDSALLDFRVCSANRRRVRGPAQLVHAAIDVGIARGAILGGGRGGHRRPPWFSPDSTAPSTTPT